MEPGSPDPALAGHIVGSSIAGRRAAPPTILVPEPKWRALVRDAERIAVRAAMAAGGAGTVVLASDRAVKLLNARHRHKNKPTNVLTFEMGGGPHPGHAEGFLGGDIILALETVAREARAAAKSPAHHLAHLVVHGALHLQGYDHHEVGEARRMEMAEARILRRLGVPNPWKRR